MNRRNKLHFFLIPAILLILIICIVAPERTFSQATMKGRVIYRKDARPAARASVSLLRKNKVIMTDEAGNFLLRMPPGTRNNDTLVISSVGYENLILPVKEAMYRTDFVLTEFSKNLTPVTVKYFTSHEVIGTTRESVGYFRSWNYDSTGGEIGRIFKVPYAEYKVDKIRFKVSNMCDTCLIRLHIRKVVDNIPGEELLKDSITLTVNRISLDDKAPEFDLGAYDLLLDQPAIFIGFELINCKHPGRKDCSFCFAGTEQGVYNYKKSTAPYWEKTDDFAIYLKMYLRY